MGAKHGKRGDRGSYSTRSMPVIHSEYSSRRKFFRNGTRSHGSPSPRVRDVESGRLKRSTNSRPRTGGGMPKSSHLMLSRPRTGPSRINAGKNSARVFSEREIRKMAKKQLRFNLAALGLSTEGNRKILIERLIEAQEAEMNDGYAAAAELDEKERQMEDLRSPIPAVSSPSLRHHVNAGPKRNPLFNKKDSRQRNNSAPNMRRRGNETEPLHIAARNGHVSAVKLLIHRGDVPLEMRTKEGDTALSLACQNGNRAVVRLLLDAKAIASTKRRDGATPLHLACARKSEGCAKELLLMSASVDAKWKSGATALVISSANGMLKTVQLLLRNGAKVNVKLTDGATPLYVASEGAHIGVVQKLISNGAKVNFNLKSGASPLYIASQNGSIDVVRVLLDEKAMVNAQRHDGATALYIASENGHARIVKVLLLAGAIQIPVRVNHAMPLYIAAQNGHPKTCRLLLEAHATVDEARSDGVTPLIISAANGHELTLVTLLQSGADVRIRQIDGATALYVASEFGHLPCVQQLLLAQSDVRTGRYDGSSPLLAAVENGHSDVILELLKANAPVDDARDDLLTPLISASSTGQDNICKMLIQSRANVLAVTSTGSTALHEACSGGHEEVVRYLVAVRAPIHAKTQDGLTPLAVATNNGHVDIANFLLENGADAKNYSQSGRWYDGALVYGKRDRVKDPARDPISFAEQDIDEKGNFEVANAYGVPSSNPDIPPVDVVSDGEISPIRASPMARKESEPLEYPTGSQRVASRRQYPGVKSLGPGTGYRGDYGMGEEKGVGDKKSLNGYHSFKDQYGSEYTSEKNYPNDRIDFQDEDDDDDDSDNASPQLHPRFRQSKKLAMMASAIKATKVAKSQHNKTGRGERKPSYEKRPTMPVKDDKSKNILGAAREKKKNIRLRENRAIKLEKKFFTFEEMFGPKKKTVNEEKAETGGESRTSTDAKNRSIAIVRPVVESPDGTQKSYDPNASYTSHAANRSIAIVRTSKSDGETSEQDQTSFVSSVRNTTVAKDRSVAVIRPDKEGSIDLSFVSSPRDSKVQTVPGNDRSFAVVRNPSITNNSITNNSITNNSITQTDKEDNGDKEERDIKEVQITPIHSKNATYLITPGRGEDGQKFVFTQADIEASLAKMAEQKSVRSMSDKKTDDSGGSLKLSPSVSTAKNKRSSVSVEPRLPDVEEEEDVQSDNRRQSPGQESEVVDATSYSEYSGAEDKTRQSYSMASKTSATTKDSAPENDGYFRMPKSAKDPSALLNKRYIVEGELGRGAYANVVQAYDKKSGTSVAIKISRKKKIFYSHAKDEFNLIKNVQKPRKCSNIIDCADGFSHNGHYCIVMGMLSKNLHELNLGVKYSGFSLDVVRVFGWQLLNALERLADKKILHRDLKPENILTETNTSAKIKLVDFGSAVPESEGDKKGDYVQSRYYRAPEVIMGLSQSCAMDMWSLGCVMFEFHTGIPLFPGRDEPEMLQRQVACVGLPPNHMIRKGKFSPKYFVGDEGDEDGMVSFSLIGDEQKSLPRATPLNKMLGEIKRANHGRPGHEIRQYEIFEDLLARMLAFDPKARVTPREAMGHPFFADQDESIGELPKDWSNVKQMKNLTHRVSLSSEVSYLSRESKADNNINVRRNSQASSKSKNKNEPSESKTSDRLSSDRFSLERDSKDREYLVNTGQTLVIPIPSRKPKKLPPATLEELKEDLEEEQAMETEGKQEFNDGDSFDSAFQPQRPPPGPPSTSAKPPSHKERGRPSQERGTMFSNFSLSTKGRGGDGFSPRLSLEPDSDQHDVSDSFAYSPTDRVLAS
ncbi:hypothetical protein AAMO2058_000303000 [Amorphochlora amoebiformis]